MLFDPRTAATLEATTLTATPTATTLTTNAWTYFDSAVLEDGELRFLHKEAVYRRVPVEAPSQGPAGPPRASSKG